MQKVSVVIVCKNEEEVIGRCLESLRGLTDDIVVLDNGSTDQTRQIVREAGVRLVDETWEGFGRTKNKATKLAKYDWVLNLDADELLTEELKNSLIGLSLEDENEVFEIKFRNFLGQKSLRFGEWGGDKHVRLFNRSKVLWKEAVVHESLLLTPGITVRRVKGFIFHYTAKDVADFSEKTVRYALLNAEKYAAQAKKSSVLKMVISPAFTFLKYYIFRLGFLDGKEGYICAKMTSYYTFLKYARLLELNKSRSR